MEKIVTIRLPNDTWKKLVTLATKENRSLSQQVRHFIERGIK